LSVARVTGFVTFSAKIKIVNDFNRLQYDRDVTHYAKCAGFYASEIITLFSYPVLVDS